MRTARDTAGPVLHQQRTAVPDTPLNFSTIVYKRSVVSPGEGWFTYAPASPIPEGQSSSSQARLCPRSRAAFQLPLSVELGQSASCPDARGSKDLDA